jgi:hypothetical protein
MGGNSGTGPGDITPDGCAVDFNALLPTLISPDELRADLAAAGLSFGQVLTEDQAWFTAKPELT